MRGCEYSGGAHDAFSYARCVTSCTLTNHHNEDWRTPIDAISIGYSGNANTATIELSGGSDTNNRVITLKEDGSVAGTFQIKNDDPDFVAGTHYHVSNVVDWLNGLPGWNATLLDNSRRASALSHTSASALGHSFSAVDVKSGSIILHTVFDPHGDAWAMNSQSVENSILFGNRMYANALPNIFLNQAGLKDVFIVNNAGQTDEVLYPDFANLASQWSKSSSHVVIAHNSIANQKLLLRTGIGLTTDAYCLLANNTMSEFEWLGTPDTNLTIADNHLHYGAIDPAGAINTSFVGDADSLFVDASSGNFTPTTQLRSESKLATVRRDRTSSTRSTSSPAGSEA